MTSITNPTFWFAAPAPINGSGINNPATQQFNDLFTPTPTSPWPVVGGQPSVVMLTYTFILQSSTAELKLIVDYINSHGLQLSMSAGMVPYQANGIGIATEGYIDHRELTSAALKIQSLGGRIDFLDMDEPLYYGHESKAPRTAQESIAAVAQQVAAGVALVKAVFPHVQVGDNEPQSSVGDMAEWAAAFQQATGTKLAYVHADVLATDPNLAANLEAYAQAVRSAGVSFGLLVDGTGQDQGDAAWTTNAIRMMAAAAANPLIRPDQYVTISWNAYPRQLLPAGLNGTLAHVAVEASEVVPLYAAGLLGGDPGGVVGLAGPDANALPAGLNAIAGASVGVPGLRLTAGTGVGASARFAVVLTDVSGSLSAQVSMGGTVTGAGTGVLMLTGSLAAINAELASVAYAGTTTGTDTIDVTAYDGLGWVGNLQVGVATATLAPNAAPGAAQAQSTITTLLQQLGALAPDSGTVATWTSALLGGRPLADIRASLANSNAVTTLLTQVAQGASGKTPTVAGIAALRSALVQGESMGQLTTSLLAGSPAQVQIGALYQRVLGTAADPSTLSQLTLAYVTGESLASIRADIVHSQPSHDALVTFYQNVYGYAATADQLISLQNQMIGGASLLTIKSQLDAVARANIVALYGQDLDRLPTAGELSVNAGRLEGGTSMAGIRTLLVYTPEEQANLSAAYVATIGATPPPTTVTLMQNMITGGLTLDTVKADIAVVVNLHQDVLGVAPGADMIATLLDQTRQGHGVSDLRALLVKTNAAYATVLNGFKSLFGHGPTAAVQASMQSQLSTTSMHALLDTLARQAASDIPTMTQLPVAETVAWNSQTLPLRSLVIADPNAGQQLRATVTLSAPVASFYGGGGTISADGLSFTTLSASADLVQQWLQNLTLRPTHASSNAAAQLTVTLSNAAGHQTTARSSLTVLAAASPMPMNDIFEPAGNTVIAATPMADLFVISSPRFGLDVITGFDVQHDLIGLPKGGFTDYAHVHAMMSSTSAGTVIRLDDQDTLTLAGVALASVTSHNFQFG